MDAWLILLPAFVLAVLIGATHAYLGLHVLARGIIFVDLALPGRRSARPGVLARPGIARPGRAALRLGAALTATTGFAGLRRIPDKTTREVAIGCVYVVATALATVILSRSSQGMEELKAMLNGSILWVQWSEIARVAVIYAALAAVHALFGKRFYALSFSPSQKQKSALWWEFLFFASFAVVITLAVNLAGVLMVFAFLIIPAFSAALLANTFGRRLVIAWGLSVAGALAGLAASYAADLPAGATVVCALGLLPLLALALRRALRVWPITDLQ